MRKAFLLAIVVVVPASTALTGPSRSQRLDKPTTTSGKALPVKRAGTSNSCATYGPGFVKVEGTETCVKIGGAISIGVGSSSGSR
jgi:hypothetical protein